jgi:gliding motility-associated-like protein
VRATDELGRSDVKSINVGGNYVPPTIQSCNISGSTATINVKDGLAPFNYAYSSDGGANFSLPQPSNVITCLDSGTYIFRVTDACNNFFPCQNRVDVKPPSVVFTCTQVSPGINTIRVTRTQDGEAPYTYSLVNNSGQTFTNSNGLFTSVPGCNYTLTVTDKCGKSRSYTNISCTSTDVRLDISCINFNTGTATLTASGGVPPYTFREAMSNITSNTGVFTGLPFITANISYRFEVMDACANRKFAWIIKPSYRITSTGCPFDSIIAVNPSSNEVIYSDLCRPNRWCAYFFYPLTFTCTNCPGSPSVVINKPNRYSPILPNEVRFTGVPPGNYTITTTDACGNTSSTVFRNQVQPLGIDVQTNTFCINRTVRVRQSSGAALPAGSTVNLRDAQNNIIATNTNGIFTLNRAGNYRAEVFAPNCAVARLDFTISYSLTPDIYCDSIGFTPCPNIGGYTYFLFDLSTNSLVQTSANNWFSGLVSGRNYRIIATNPLLQDSIVFNFRSGELPPQFIADSITCSSFLINPVPIDFVWKDKNNIPPRYIVFDGSGNEVRNQLVNDISNIAPGNYSFTVTHPICGVRQNTVTISPNPQPSFCLNPSDSYNAVLGDSNTCAFAWNVTYNSGTSNIRIRGGPNNINRFFDGNGVYQLNNLLPGSYTVETECGNQAFTLPANPLKVTAEAISTCPGSGRIDAKGGLTDVEWGSTLASLGFTHCGGGLAVRYRLKSFVGTVLAQNSSGIFTGLQPGLTYKIDMLSPNGCKLDSIEITIPFYVRPQLTTTFGTICGNPAVGSVQATVVGGVPPFRFEIISPTGFAPINTSNRTVTFNNLPGGNYRYRVSDSCGVSAEFSSGVEVLNFTPRYRRLCKGGIQLEAPTMIGATYTWRDGAGNVVGTTANPIVPDNGADTYSLSIVFGNCTYSRTLDVPLQTIPAVSANAGPDIVDTTGTTQLQGVNPGVSGVVVFWSQTFPSSGNTIFSDFQNAQSNITVSQFPGQYTYVWTVDGGANGCVDYDTVTVFLVECPGGIKDITADLTLTPTSCTAADGKARALVTSPGPAFSYFWSTGGRADTLGGLLPGKYSITIRDGDICTRDFFREFDIIPGITIHFNNNQTICEGDSVKVGNKIYKSTGVYRDTLPSFFLCDSVVITNLVVHPIEKDTINRSICDGQVFDFNGTPLTNQGVYQDTLATIFGCDSIITLNLTVNPIQVTNLFATICSDEIYIFAGQNLNLAGIYSDTLNTILGCDSIVILDLTVNPVQNTVLNEAICEGDTYSFNGRSLNQQGIYIDTLSTYLSCDSIITLQLTVNPTSAFSFDIAICEGESFNFFGTDLTQQGIYTQVINNFLGCDSTITLNLIVNPVKTTVLNQVICEGETFLFEGDSPTVSGSYTKVLKTYLNCDSTVILNLTVFAVPVIPVAATICSNESFDFNGRQLNQAGVYTDTLKTSLNCDSIVVLTLTVNQVRTVNISASICEGTQYDFNGTFLGTAGTYKDTLRTYQNCDSIIILLLDVRPIKFFDISAAICDGDVYDFNGRSLTVTGIYLDTVVSSINCDSVISLNLKVNPVKVTNLRDTICEGDTYNFIGQTLTLPGNYSRVLSTYLDCDSTVNLNLTVLPRSFITLNVEICEGERYNFNGVFYSRTGTYLDTLPNYFSCDSIITLNLNVLPRQRVGITGEICDNETYDFNGLILNTQGRYIDTLQDINGCDSIITLDLTVHPTFVIAATDSFCTGDTYIFGNQQLTSGGVYDGVLNTVFGCDSIVRLTLLQRNIPTVELGKDTFICDNLPVVYNLPLEVGTSATWQDGTVTSVYAVTTRGDYKVVVQNFCGRDEDEVTITAGCDGCDVYLPSAFTPNRDNINDRFIPKYGCDPIQVNDFFVADRWGNIVFRTNQLGEGWDGTWKGQPSPMDNYVWYIDITFIFNNEVRRKQEKGTILLIR